MIANDRIPMDSEGEIDLIAIGRLLWGYKYLVVLVSLLCGLAAAVLALRATPIYRAEAVVTEVQGGGMSAAASLANQFGGLASLAGINLGSSGENRDAQALLKSHRLVEEFIKRHTLLSELFPNAKKPPTVWLAVRKFQENVLSIREDKRSGVTIVAINWSDATTAARWADGFVSLANELIRVRALDDSKRNIAYLNDQIARTDVVELRRVMYNLIEAETKTLMLANAKAEYAFTIIDPAVPPEIRISPKRTFMVMIGVLLGFFIGAIIAFTHDRMSRHGRGTPQSP